MSNTTAYSFLNVTAILDGQKVRGLFDGDDAISTTPGADIGTGMVGADGCALFSQSADDSAMITLKLQHTSPTHRQLSRLLRRQKNGQLDGFPFSVIEKRSGEGGNSDKCFIKTAPTDSKGTNATVREWQIWAGEWNEEIPN